MHQGFSILTFCHLRWDFVYQRPQHLLSRLASQHRVIFIEEPVFDASAAPHWERLAPEPNVTILRPHTPVHNPGFNDEQLVYIRDLLKQFLEETRLQDYVAWFYTPMALPAAEDLKPLAVIYDCMDELSAFLNAPPELLRREDHLLKLADVVFTGGPSLYRAKKDRHHNVHCFPSSVDSKHFAKARSLPEAVDQSALPYPRLGFFGVIDERLDTALLDTLARAHPDWQIVMVGPVVKIDESVLPRHPNVHYFGQRSYADLPGFLGGWDVCLLPFARNDSTRFISPTKTLEYMAAEKMIVSTPITDVAEPYGGIVYLGGTPREFVRCCEKALAVGGVERQVRVTRMREVLSRTSWDTTAGAMRRLIIRAAGNRPSARDGQIAAGEHPAAVRPSAEGGAVDAPAVVIGAGPTGLSAAYHLGADSLLLEQNETVGGWCRSVDINGFTFDYAGHIMFSNESYVHQLYKMLLGGNVHWQDREAWIYSKNVYTRYPFQGSLHGLPPNVIKECIVGAIEARFGALKQNRKGHSNGNGNGSPLNGKSNGSGKAAACKPGAVNDCCADGILESSAELANFDAPDHRAAEPRNFEEFIYKVWGAGIAKHFAIPYNRKLWAVPLDQMETSWLGGRVPMPDLEEMIEGALSPAPKPMGPNARFGYPLRGGFQALMDGWLPHLKGRVLLNSRVAAVSPSRRTVTLDNGRTYRYGHLISTMPLPVLIGMIGDEVPAEIRAAAGSLRHVSVRCVHIGVGRERLTEKHWIYYPEDTVFHRIFVQGNASPHCNPPGGFGLTCEITYSEYKPLPCEDDDLIRRCIDDCHRVGIFKPEDPVWATAQVDLPYAYVVYDHARKENVGRIRQWLEERGIILAGRYSEWEYYNSDHAFIAGQRAAQKVRELERAREVSSFVPRAWELTGSRVEGD